MAIDKQKLVNSILTRNNKEKVARKNWEALWNLAGEFVNPQHGSMLADSVRIAGEKRGDKAYEGTPEWAKDLMVAGLYTGLCSDADKWFKWSMQNPAMNQDEEVKRFLEAATETAYYAVNGSNYGEATKSAFEHQASFGTSIKYIEKNAKTIINTQIFRLTDCVFFEDEYGNVDTLFREFDISARNAIKKWGDKCPDIIRQMDESGNPDDTKQFLHAVCPREDYDPTRIDRVNMPIASYWIFPGERKLIDEGGYWGMPYTVTRMYKQAGEKCGRGAAIKALQDMGLLNQMEKDNLLGAHKMVKPPLAIPADAFNKRLDLSPDGHNYFNPSKGRIEPINTIANLPFSVEMQDRKAKAVSRWFHTDTFLMISQAIDSQKTATEVMELKQEKLEMLGPLIGSQKRGHLDLDLDRIFSICLETEYFPPIPDILLDSAGMGQIQTEYTGPLFEAQRKRDSQSIIKVYQTAGLMAQTTQRPEVLDNLNDDRSFRIIADRETCPNEALNAIEEVKAIRQQRQQALQMQEMAQQGMAAVEAAKSLGQTPTGTPEEPNALGDLGKMVMGGMA